MVLTLISMLVGIVVLLGIITFLIVAAVMLHKRFGVGAAVAFIGCILLAPLVFATLAWVTVAPMRMVQTPEVTLRRLNAEGDPVWAGPTPVAPPVPIDLGEAIRASVTEQVQDRKFPITPNILADIQIAAQPNAPASAWSSTELDTFQASLHPGLVRCGAPLARNIARVINEKEMLPTDSTDETSTVFQVYRDLSLGDKGDSFVNEFVDELARQFPDAQVTRSKDQPESPENAQTLAEQTFALTLSASLEKAKSGPFGSRKSDERGEVECQVMGRSGSAGSQLRFVEKPWIYGFDKLVSDSPEKQFVVGFSANLASTEVEARQMAMENAQSQIRITNRYGVNTLIDETHVIDRFAQKLSRPYGDVWREAVLVDVTGEAMTGSIAVANARAERSQIIKHGSAMTAVILLLCTIAVCFVANGLTQGYYRQKIGLGAGVVGAIVILVGLIFLGNVT